MNKLHFNKFANSKDSMRTIDTMGGRIMLARKDRMALLTVQVTDAEASLQLERQAGRRVDRLEEVVSSGLAMLTLAEIPTANAFFRRLVRVWVKDNNVSSVDVI